MFSELNESALQLECFVGVDTIIVYKIRRYFLVPADFRLEVIADIF